MKYWIYLDGRKLTRLQSTYRKGLERVIQRANAECPDLRGRMEVDAHRTPPRKPRKKKKVPRKKKGGKT